METLERKAQSIRAHRQDTLAQHDFAVSLRSSLESFIHSDMARLFQDVGTFDALLVSFIRTYTDKIKIDYGRNGSLRG